VKEMQTDENISVIEKLNAYLENARIIIKPSSAAVYQRYMDSYIQPYFKDMLYSQLSSDKIQEFIVNLTKSGLSAVTVQAVYSFLKAGLKPSGKDSLFDVTLPKYSRQQVEYLSLDEQKRLEDAAKKEGNPMYLTMMIGLYTGIRLGELCGLMWDDIDFSLKIMRIRRTLQRIAMRGEGDSKTQIIISEPKSPSSLRNIPLPGFLLSLLREYKQNADSEYVLSAKGKHLEPRYIQNHFKRLLKAANVKDVNFHTVRHTFATRALENGFDVKSLSEILGHASATVTLDKYAHVLDDHKRKLMEKMADNCFNIPE
jgi:integrase